MSTNDSSFPDLCRAIGRVVISSAMAEELFREILDDFGPVDAYARVFNGQNVDWLRDAVKAALQDSSFHTYPLEDRPRFFAACAELATLGSIRNRVVHSEWRNYSVVDDGPIFPRPWGEPDSDQEWYATRWRKSGIEEAAFTIADIDLLADKFDAAQLHLARIWREMRPERHRKWGVLQRWPE